MARKLQEDGLSPGYVKLIVGVLCAVMAAARDYGVPVRPDAVAGLGRLFKLAKSVSARRTRSRRSIDHSSPGFS